MVRRGRLQSAVLAGQPLLLPRCQRPERRGRRQPALERQRGEISAPLQACGGRLLPSHPASRLRRGGCLDRRTTGAERSRSWFRARPTGSGLRASTASAGATSAPSASSRPASLVSLERPLLLKSRRCGRNGRKVRFERIRPPSCLFFIPSTGK